jgi:hypothetical protein
MEEKLHVFVNSELGEGTGNRHACAALQLQKYTPVPTGLGVHVSQGRSESFGEQTCVHPKHRTKIH